jgi:hypothetical protein
METSTLNGANGTRAHGIVPLSMKEIELVAGGKAAEMPQSVWDRLIGWIEGLFSSPPSGSGRFTITGDQLITLQQACLDAGGNFSAEVNSGSGGFVLRLAGGEVEGATLRITCTRP